ncbi:hypothetical protein EMCRGX_G014267 [Ephydatia muelleri]|eukprot:Em0008g3a
MRRTGYCWATFFIDEHKSFRCPQSIAGAPLQCSEVLHQDLSRTDHHHIFYMEQNFFSTYCLLYFNHGLF